MSFWLRIADKMILDQSRDPIDPEDRRRATIEVSSGKMEAWIWSECSGAEEQPSFLALKFPGAGGRAERGGPHPCDIFRDSPFDVWTINPPGYGGSDGQASVAHMVETAECAWQAIKLAADSAPVIVVGNSLGCLYAPVCGSQAPGGWTLLS